MSTTRTRKRPCSVCRRWFLPDVHQIGRQQTCGSPGCQKELHRRRCRQWNKKNREYFKANYLSAKLERTKDPPEATISKSSAGLSSGRMRLGLPKQTIIEVVGVQQFVILKYIIEQVMQAVGGAKPGLRPP